MKRIVMTLDQIREESTYFYMTNDYGAGIMALVEVENMGWCRDGVTRWYHFTNDAGQPAVYYKRQASAEKNFQEIFKNLLTNETPCAIIQSR